MADENIPTATVDALRAAGHDVLSIAEEQPGSPDDVVLDLAVAQSRILITFDTDFGRFLHSYPFPGLSGVMLLRFPPRSPEDPADVIKAVLKRDDVTLNGRFTVVHRDRIRQRILGNPREMDTGEIR